jgi:hypothetical protein
MKTTPTSRGTTPQIELHHPAIGDVTRDKHKIGNPSLLLPFFQCVRDKTVENSLAVKLLGRRATKVQHRINAAMSKHACRQFLGVTFESLDQLAMIW